MARQELLLRKKVGGQPPRGQIELGEEREEKKVAVHSDTPKENL